MHIYIYIYIHTHRCMYLSVCLHTCVYLRVKISGPASPGTVITGEPRGYRTDTRACVAAKRNNAGEPGIY